jgi:hypothetical protein
MSFMRVQTSGNIALKVLTEALGGLSSLLCQLCVKKRLSGGYRQDRQQQAREREKR